MKFNLKERGPIWIALSALYLDTELQDYELRYIARKIYNSPYDLDEVRNIDTYEVFPVLYQNALSITGVWNGFQEDWLVETIATRLKNRNYFQKKVLELKYLSLKWRFKRYWEQIEKKYLHELSSES